jgi:predicted nucleotidyltransferase
MTKQEVIERLIEHKEYKECKEYKEFLKEHFEVKEIGIFGSVTRDSFNEKSYIGIYVEFKMESVYLDNYLGLTEFLEIKLKRKVDVITKGGFQTI